VLGFQSGSKMMIRFAPVRFTPSPPTWLQQTSINQSINSARVPTGVKDDDLVRNGQVHTQSAHLVAQTTINQSIVLGFQSGSKMMIRFASVRFTPSPPTWWQQNNNQSINRARVPVGVKDDDLVRTGQVHNQSTHLMAQTSINQTINRARVPIGVKDDDPVRTGQVQTQSVHLDAQTTINQSIVLGFQSGSKMMILFAPVRFTPSPPTWLHKQQSINQSIVLGFQSGSKMMIRFALVRFTPSPPTWWQQNNN
jgi:hypothetical protein